MRQTREGKPIPVPKSFSLRRSLFLLLAIYVTLTFAFSGRAAAQQPAWVPQGPGPNTRGQVENIDRGEVIGAIRVVTAHPTDANIVYIGAVNGGIWRTANGMDPKPTWQHETDDTKSMSIGALAFDPTDPSHQTLVAGVGRFSSLAQHGGRRTGLLRTVNGGVSWTTVNSAEGLSGFNISGVAPRGETIILSVNYTDDCDNSGNCDDVGIWRCGASGGGCKKVSGEPGTGLPKGASSCLVGDPLNSDILYTNAGGKGLYRTNNGGASWSKISSVEMDSLIAQADNLKIAVGNSKNLYVAIDVPYDPAKEKSRLAGVFRSGDGGSSWKKMDLPMTPEGGIHPGSQGGLHLSIAADPANSNIVYIGGDAQPGDFPAHPNSIGALDYSGRLFRGDASQPFGKQWVHLTHSNKLGAKGGGTAHGSAPHADSRDMSVAANGVLLEVDDGGIYRRTSPQTNTGDWFSMNGDLQVTEFHSVAWDSNCHLVVGGAQDTGTPEQESRSGVLWQSISRSDGGVVAVDDASTPRRSVRYSSIYGFFYFLRQVYDDSNVLQSEINPPLTVLDRGSPIDGQFYTPIRLNTVAPTRLIIGAGNSVYESMDQGDSVREIGPGIVVNGTGPNPIAYGAKGNPDILYVGVKNQVYVRKAANPAPLELSGSYTGDTVLGISLNPTDGNMAFVVSPGQVFQTPNAGGSWKEVTGNLKTLAEARLRSIAYCNAVSEGLVIVGTDNGVFAAHGPGFSSWSRLGTGLPNAPIYQVEYSPVDHIVLAGTLGRGAWILPLSPSMASSPATAERQISLGQRETHAVSQLVQPEISKASYQLSGSSDTPQQPGQGGVFQLAPGVLVDTGRSRVYAMSPDGGIHAVNAINGEKIWATRAAAKPIGFAGDRVIAQAETPGSESKLVVVALDPLTGAKTVAGGTSLPAYVRPSIGQTLSGDFLAAAMQMDGNTVVSWEFREPVRRTLPPGTKSELPSSGGVKPLSIGPEKVNKGSFRMDLATGAVSPVDVTSARPEALEFFLESLQPRTNETGQVLSADGRNILVSRLTGNTADLEKYTLAILDRKTNVRLGEFKSYVSVVPFILIGSRVIYDSPAYVQRVGSELVQQLPKIKAIELLTGQQVWSLDLRDTAYRGSFPP